MIRSSSWLVLVPWSLVGACSSAPPVTRPVAATTVVSASALASEIASAPTSSGAAPMPPPLPPSAPGAPGLDALLGRLQAIGSQRFDKAAQARGCPATQTLGEYVDLLVREGTPTARSPDTLRRLSASCRDFPTELAPVDPPASDAHWYCQIDAFATDRDGESPWHYELRLRVRRSDGFIDSENLSCPGTP